MASSSSSSHQPCRYQVFLSFRGEDTRHNFTSHLLEALKSRGVNVFFDEENLEKGDELSPALLNAIVASKMSIPIFSKDYASSKSCLIELSQIMECKRDQKQIVLPIFYHVNPSDVRHQSGSFEQSFNQHLINKPNEVGKWKAAFTQAGQLKGWHIDGGIFDRSEPKYIEDIVEVVIKGLSSKSTNFSEDLVGIDDKIEKILLLIDQEDIRVIGICGMGGIGKTTLAEAVYFEVVSGSRSRFDAHCFLQDVREKSLESYGMQSLQNELLSKLLKGDFHIETRFIGSALTQDRLRNVRAFVVFDDVDNLDQIKRLGVQHYGSGSKIIVVSRDRQVLRNIGADEVYEMEKLDKDESLQLFCNFAFKQDNPTVELQDLSMKFVGYSGGNPLALKVLGAALYGKDRDVWESAWDKLEEYPERKIMNVLRISFDGLDRLEKDIFLDFACLGFSGLEEDYVTNSLKCCYKGALFGLESLLDKCLIDIVDNFNIQMHDLLQELGRDIVRQESENPGRRSRLCVPEDVCNVLQNNKGTESIKGIFLNYCKVEALQISPTIFKKMENLIFIKFFDEEESYDSRSNRFRRNPLLLANENLAHLPDELRYFHWEYCPIKCLPSKFTPNNLVGLNLRGSDIEQLWNEDQDVIAVNLRRMDLSFCKNLRKIPNLLGAVKLENLLCGGCISLDEFPCIMHLTSLVELVLRDCPIARFPEIPAKVERINLSGTQIEELPPFIGSIKKLKILNIGRTKIQNVPSSILKLEELRQFYLSYCPNITELNLAMTCDLEQIPSSISGLQKSLESLSVDSCKSLKSLSMLPPWVSVHANGCTSLEKVSFLDQCTERHSSLRPLSNFNNCFKLNRDALNNIIEAYPMTEIQSTAKKSAKTLTRYKLDVFKQEWQMWKVHFSLPGCEIPDKFGNQSKNSSITVKLDSATNTRRFLCFALSIVVNFEHFFQGRANLFGDIICFYDCHIESEYQLKGTDSGSQNFKREWDFDWGVGAIPMGCYDEYVFVLFRADMIHRDLNYKEASFDFRLFGKNKTKRVKEMKVEKCGVHVFYVDVESFTVTHVDSGIKLSSNEDEICSPNIIQPYSPAQPSQEFGVDDGDLGGSPVEEDVNVEIGFAWDGSSIYF